MQIKNISLKDFSEAFNKSYDTGTQYYFLFVMLGVLNVFLNSIIESAVLFSIFTTLSQAGVIFIAQTAIEDKQQPNLAQYFAAYSRGHVLERLKTFVVFHILLTIATSYLVGFLMVKMDSYQEALPSSSPFILFSSVYISSLIAMPFMFTGYILVLQNYSWTQSFGLSFKGFTKNIISYFIAVLMPFPLLALMDPELYNIYDKPITWILKALYCLIYPAFVLFYYNLYKKIFSPERADLQIKNSH